MTSIRSDLEAHLEGAPSPFLFAGSGISRRYCGLPDWASLLRDFAAETPYSYDYFRTSADGALPKIGSLIAEEFHNVWWQKRKYASQRTEWSERISSRESALKVAIASKLNKDMAKLPKTGLLAQELELLRSAVVDGILTTNYDPLIENLFPDFQKFVGQSELLFATNHSIGEIYKIHGCISAPESILLTAADYQRFASRDSYLAAKLMTIFVEHPVVFLGYSLSDPNIISLLKSIVDCLTDDNLDDLRDRLIFIDWSPDSEPHIGSHSITIDDHVLPVLRVTVPDFLDVLGALASLKRTFPARILRRLKDHVYDLVLKGDPHNRLFVQELGEAQNEEIDVVLGVGIGATIGQHGYVGISRWDLVEDIISLRSEPLDAGVVVRQTLPQLIKGNVNVPVHKFLRECDLLTQTGLVRASADLPDNVRSMATKISAGMPANKDYARRSELKLEGIGSIADLEEDQGAGGVFAYAACLDPGLVNLDYLKEFLQREYPERAIRKNDTLFVKLVCFYDFLKHGRRLK